MATKKKTTKRKPALCKLEATARAALRKATAAAKRVEAAKKREAARAKAHADKLAKRQAREKARLDAKHSRERKGVSKAHACPVPRKRKKRAKKAPSRKAVAKEMKEHPWAGPEVARQIATDHANPVRAAMERPARRLSSKRKKAAKKSGKKRGKKAKSGRQLQLVS